MRISKDEPDYGNEPSALLERKQTFWELPLRQKFDYIWDYYKWWFLWIAIGITLLAVTVPSVIENRKEMVLYTVFLNTTLKGQEYTTLMDDYVDYAGIDMDGKRITLDCSIYIDRENPSPAAMQSSQKLTALFSAKTIDVTVGDEGNFNFCSSQGAYMDLRELLPPELLEKYGDYLVEAKSPATGEMVPYGISLRDSQVLKREKAFDFDPIVAVCLTTEQKDNAVAFIQFLMEQP